MSSVRQFGESGTVTGGCPLVLDRRLRPYSEQVLDVFAARCTLPPWILTAVALAWGLAAAGLAAGGRTGPALACFIANRLFDGLDGVVARRHGRASDLGGYLDMVSDTITYVSLPIGVAIGLDQTTVWIATAFALGSFSVNIVTWTYLSALLERRGRGAASTGEATSITMPSGLVEGTETGVWFALLLTVPDLAAWWLGSMAFAVTVGAAMRVVGGASTLSADVGAGSPRSGRAASGSSR